jgi:NitT/TauT family transport system substrate-binding protein
MPRFPRPVAAFLLCLLLNSCNQEQSAQESDPGDIIRIAISQAPLSLPIYVAHEQGYFRSEGLNVVLEDTIGGYLCLEKVLDNKAELATTTEYPVVLNSFTRNDYVINATFATSTNDVKIITRRDTGLTTGGQLKGKRIGTSVGSSSHYFLDRFLLFNGLETGDVTLVDTRPDQLPEKLANGTVDVISVWEPFGYIAYQKLGENLNIFPNQNLYRETFNLVSKKAFADQNPGLIRKLIRALTKANNFIATEPKSAQGILVKRLALDHAFINWIWDDFRFDIALGQPMIVTMENEARWAIRSGLKTGPGIPNYLEYINAAPLREEQPESVTIL